MKAWIKNNYLDGGTEQVVTEDGEIYYVDHRLGSPTDGKVFDHYPDDHGAKQLDLMLEIVGDWRS